MCEIQLITKNNKELDYNDTREFLRLLHKGSLNNDDAFGIFSKEYKLKDGKPFHKIKKKHKKSLCRYLENKHFFLVGHNRLSTQGTEKDNKNNHPFETKNYLMVHNGIIQNDDEIKKKYNLEYEEKTDSAVLINLIQHFKNSNNTTIESIKLSTKELGGSFSIVLYDKTEDKLYYFKNENTSFNFAKITTKTKQILLGSTNKISLQESYEFKKNINEMINVEFIQPKPNTIYEIKNNELNEVDTIEFKTIIYEYNNIGSYRSYYNWNTWEHDLHSKNYDDSYYDLDNNEVNEILNIFLENYITPYTTKEYELEFVGDEITLTFKENDSWIARFIEDDYIGYFCFKNNEKSISFYLEDAYRHMIAEGLIKKYKKKEEEYFNPDVMNIKDLDYFG